MKKKLTAAGLLLAVIISASATACGEASEEIAPAAAVDTAVQETAAEPAETDVFEGRAALSDGLPEKDYGGRRFYILGHNENQVVYFAAEEENGDIMNDTLYQRNIVIEDRFNVDIQIDVSKDMNAAASFVSKSTLAGEDAVDLISMHVVTVSGIVTNDIVLNWYDIPYVDFEKPWWSPSNINDLTYNNVALLAIGSYAMSTEAVTFCMFFNKRLAESYGIPDLYETVNNGQWTIDRLAETVNDVYTDLNGNSKRDNDDFYGITIRSGGTHIAAFQWAFDNPVMVKDDTGRPTLVGNTEKMPVMLSKLCDLMHNNTGAICSTDYSFYCNKFSKGETIFVLGCVYDSVNYFRDMTDNYGLIPYPKLDEAQPEYKTMVNGCHEAMAVSKAVSDPEYIGIITEALCAETYKTVEPVYYDIVLKLKGARDEISVDMLDMIMNSRVFDFGFIYDNWKGPSFLLQDLAVANKTDYASAYAKKESSYIQHYNDVLAAFEAYMH